MGHSCTLWWQVSKDASVPNSLDKFSACCGAPIRESAKTTVHKCIPIGKPGKIISKAFFCTPSTRRVRYSGKFAQTGEVYSNIFNGSGWSTPELTPLPSHLTSSNNTVRTGVCALSEQCTRRACSSTNYQ